MKVNYLTYFRIFWELCKNLGKVIMKRKIYDHLQNIYWMTVLHSVWLSIVLIMRLIMLALPVMKHCYGEGVTAPHTASRIVYSFDKVTLVKGQVFRIYFYEDGGPRNFVLSFGMRDLNK